MNILFEIKNVINFLILEKNFKKFVFFIESKSHWLFFKGIIEEFIKNEVKITVLVSEKTDFIFNHKNLKKFNIGKGHLRDWLFFNLDIGSLITTTPDIGNSRIKKSKFKIDYIYIQHSLCSLNMIYNDNAFNCYDIICASGPHHVEEIKEIFYKKKITNKIILNIGYSKIDYLINLYQKRLNQNKLFKQILIAPSWGEHCIIESGLYLRIIKS